MLELEYQDLEDKIEKTCIEQKLKCEFKKNAFPVIVTIQPGGDEKQVVIDGFDNEPENRQNGKLQFIFGEDLKISIDDNFDITDDLFNKIKNNLKKWHYVYLQYFYQVVREREMQ